jgi:hypothetical protein
LLGVDYPLVLSQAASHGRIGDRRCAVGIASDHILRDTWLTIPQAVVWEVTGNLLAAINVQDADPNLLLIKAIWRLPPLMSGEVDDIETIRQKHMAAVGAGTGESGYESGSRKLLARLAQGVTAKGSRAPGLPLEVIDPAEFTRLQLRGIDAVDARTRKQVWYSIVINARELLENSEGDFSHEFRHLSLAPSRLSGARNEGYPRAACPDRLLERVARRTAPLSERDLRTWYRQRIQALIESGNTASGEADWKAVRQQFSGRVTRARVRALRNEFAPEDWKKQGRRSPPTE